MKTLKLILILLFLSSLHACNNKSADNPDEATEAAEDSIAVPPGKSIIEQSGDTLGSDQIRAEEKRESDLDARAVDFGTPAGN